MCFMGYKTFKEFERMLQALRYGDYEKAAQEIQATLWAQQVGHQSNTECRNYANGGYMFPTSIIDLISKTSPVLGSALGGPIGGSCW